MIELQLSGTHLSASLATLHLTFILQAALRMHLGKREKSQYREAAKFETQEFEDFLEALPL